MLLLFSVNSLLTVEQKTRVAVIGGGIAGIGAAWSLHRTGNFDVHVIESKDYLGGNARIFRWKEQGLVSGLSVLAWPDQHFHNYNELLKTLNIGSDKVALNFFVESSGGEVFAHGQRTDLRQTFARDLKKWKNMVWTVSMVNKLSQICSSNKSPYGIPAWNPCNFISLHTLTRLFGISKDFWDIVVVGIHSSTFLTVNIKPVPAVICPLLEDILSLSDGAVMSTWAKGFTSANVFDKMTQGFKQNVRLECDLLGMKILNQGSANQAILLETPTGPLEVDKVIFACSADAVAKLLPESKLLNCMLLKHVEYVEDTDPTFAKGVIHTDQNVLPQQHRSELLQHHCNYVKWSNDSHLSNTFIISSWAPQLRDRPRDMHMLVTYNCPLNQTIQADKIEGTVTHSRAHPSLSMRNLIIASLLHLHQGRDGMYYCGSWTTPGNGHDLSLLSGFAIAEALGAPYPFAHIPQCKQDYDAVATLLLRKSHGKILRFFSHCVLVAVVFLTTVKLL